MGSKFLAGLSREGRPFLPIVYRLAAAIEQVAPEELARDAATLTRCLRSAQRLFGYPMVVNHFDLTLLSVACGARASREAAGEAPAPLLAGPAEMEGFRPPPWEEAGGVPVVLEATRRMVTEFRGSPGVAGVVPGPFLVAAQLAGREFGAQWGRRSSAAEELAAACSDLSLGLLKKFAEIRVALLLVVDQAPPLPGDWERDLFADFYRPLVNVAGYFEIPLGVCLQGAADPAVGGPLGDLAPDAVVFLQDPPDEFVLGTRLPPSCPVGVPLPATALAGQTETLREWTARWDACGRDWFAVSPGEVAPATPPRQLHDLLKSLAALS